MSMVTAPSGWIGRWHPASASSRSAIAEVRGRMRAQERRVASRLVLGAALALVVALLLVWVRLQVVHTGYDLSTARRLERRLEREQRELTLEIATLTSPRRLELLARRLGMQPPAPGQVVVLP